MLECNQSQIQQFLQIQGEITDISALIKSIIALIRDLMVTYILTKVGAEWLIFGDEILTKVSFSNFSKFKGKELRMFSFDLFQNQTHPRPYGQIYCGQVW